MRLEQSVSMCFSKYATFSGRASRSEYWWFVLFITILTIFFRFADGNMVADQMNVGPLEGIWSLVTIIPYLAVWVRRLHDASFSGYWPLYYILAIIIVYSFLSTSVAITATVMLGLFSLYQVVIKGNEGENEYGPDPLK